MRSAEAVVVLSVVVSTVCFIVDLCLVSFRSRRDFGVLMDFTIIIRPYEVK